MVAEDISWLKEHALWRTIPPPMEEAAPISRGGQIDERRHEDPRQNEGRNWQEMLLGGPCPSRQRRQLLPRVLVYWSLGGRLCHQRLPQRLMENTAKLASAAVCKLCPAGRKCHCRDCCTHPLVAEGRQRHRTQQSLQCLKTQQNT